MRRFRRQERGLAEIVGTLMLVLIVVVAVTAFSLFVASYQAQLQAEQKAAHDRSLENIRILSVSTVPNGASYSSLSFVAGSLDVNTMTVNELLINGQFINYYTVTPLGSQASLLICPLCNPTAFPLTVQEFNLTSLEQVTITVSLTLQTSSNPTGGFVDPYTLATSGPTGYVSISLYTTLGNDFNRAFTAPTAVALTEPSQIYSGSSYTPVVVFDGSGSIVPANDSIVSWSWFISDGTVACLELSGEKALVPQSEFPDGTYSVTLTITDSNGLAGTATIPFTSTVTSPAIGVCPAQGPAGAMVTVSGTGFAVNKSITSMLDGMPAVSSCTSGPTGSFSCTVTIPTTVPRGIQSLVATDTTNTAAVPFTVTVPAISLSPVDGPVGATYAVTGSGFSVSLGATISFSGSPLTPTGGLDCAFAGTAITTDGSGGFVCTFTVPSEIPGAYSVVGTDTATTPTLTSTQTFTVIPAIAVSPTRGVVGTTYTVTGSGFKSGSGAATISFNGVLQTPTGGSDCAFTGTAITTDGSGGFVCTFTVPSLNAGPYSVVGEDTATSLQSAAQTYTITLPITT